MLSVMDLLLLFIYNPPSFDEEAGEGGGCCLSCKAETAAIVLGRQKE